MFPAVVFWFGFCFKLSRIWNSTRCWFCHCRSERGLEGSLLLPLLPMLWPRRADTDAWHLCSSLSPSWALFPKRWHGGQQMWFSTAVSAHFCHLPHQLLGPWPWESPIYPVPFPVSYHMLPVFLLMTVALWMVHAGVLKRNSFRSSLINYWQWA